METMVEREFRRWTPIIASVIGVVAVAVELAETAEMQLEAATALGLAAVYRVAVAPVSPIQYLVQRSVSKVVASSTSLLVVAVPHPMMEM
jgi:hypothetical protein